MRIVRRRIHQAFPSLDQYEPDAAARIVAVARRSIVAKILSVLACFTVFFLAAFPFPLLLAILAYSNFDEDALPDDWMWVTFGAAFAACICLGVFAAFIARDLLLARRIRKVLSQPNRCVGCGYELTGLAPCETGEVRCPECDLQGRNLIAIDELAAGSEDEGTQEPHMADAMPRGAPRAGYSWKPLWWGGAAIIVLTIGVLVVAVMVDRAVTREAAARASAARVGLPRLTALAEVVQSVPASSAEQDGWGLLVSALAVQDGSDKNAGSDGLPAGIGKKELATTAIDTAFVGGPQGYSQLIKTRWDKAQVARYRIDGVWEAYDTIAQIKRGVAPLIEVGAPFGFGIDPWLELRFHLSCMLLVQRMNAAVETGNMPDLVAAYESTLALGRLMQMQPTFRLFKAGCVVELLAHETLVRHLMRSPTRLGAPTLRELLAALRRQMWVAPPSHPWDGETIAQLEVIAGAYSNPITLRRETRSPLFEWMVYTASGPMWPTLTPGGEFGTFESATDEFKARAEARFRFASLPIPDRRNLPEAGPAKHLIINCLERVAWSYPGLDASLASSRAGVSTLIAIEHYKRLHNQSLPKTLEEAVDGLPALPPIDPYTGASLVFKPCNQSSDRLRRSYVLYSVGEDQHDDDGYAPPTSFLRIMLPRASAVPANVADFDQVYNITDEHTP